MPLKPLLKTLSTGQTVSSSMLEDAFMQLLSGSVPAEQVGAFLMGLAVRGENRDELLAGARIMRAQARRIQLSGPVLDTCGTGGLGWTSLNTSTASALVIAACGGKVAKHGNRSVPPKTGSADVLEALGVQLDLDESRFRSCFQTAGVGFLYARTHHSAMRHVAPVRASLGIRTIFNLLGPLSNPAGVTHHILGVNQARWLRPMAETLRDLGVERAWLVHGRDDNGRQIDELSIGGETQLIELNNGTLSERRLTPEEAGLPRHALSALNGGTPAENAAAIRDLVEGRTGPFRDAVCLNAAAGLHILGQADTLSQGVEMACTALDSGQVIRTLHLLVDASNGRL